MKIAVINEISTCQKNEDVIAALADRGHTIYNVGMTNPDEQPQLSYIETGFMGGILLNAQACDMVVGGCGTGQGFINMVMQFPGVFCGLILSPLDAWLFSQINAGNCVSLALAKDYGWGGNINLRYIFDKLFCDEAGGGYPPHRSVPQGESREKMKGISRMTHLPMEEIVQQADEAIMQKICGSRRFVELVEKKGRGPIAKLVLDRV